MNRTRALTVSLAVAIAAAAGVFSVAHTVALGAASRSTNDAKIAQRSAQLDRYEASLRRALARKPPALPPVPATVSQTSTLQSAVPAKVVYHRPPPIVVVKHPAGGEGEHEYEGGGADD
jgi:Na+/H+ antiporter NhaB